MADSTIKMSYIPAQFRVRVEFSKQDTLNSPYPPEDLIPRAEKKLQVELQGGRIDFYHKYEARLLTVWNKLRASNEDVNTTVAVTLVTGVPRIEGVIVSKADEKEHKERGIVGYLTVTAAPKEVAEWRARPFKLHIVNQLILLGVTSVIDPAHVQAAWLDACAGTKIDHYPLYILPKIPEQQDKKKSYLLLRRPEFGQLLLVVHDVKSIVEGNQFKTLGDDVIRHLEKMKTETKAKFHVLDEDIVREIRSAYRGVERFGVDLPLVQLVALTEKGTSAIKSNSSKEGAREEVNSVLSGFVEIQPSADRMSITISKVSPDLATNPGLFQVQAWKDLLKFYGVKFGFDEKVLNSVIEKAKLKENLLGIVLAEGKQPVPMTQPFLESVYLTSAEEKENSNMRESQRRSVVRAGQVIAKLRYSAKEERGMTVFGDDIAPPPPERVEVTIGPDVERVKNSFVSKVDGVPQIDGFSINITKLMVIDKSVNLATGNVHFSGQVEVKGDIEDGAVVHVGGDLIVHGLILGGYIKAKGNIIVDGGIITQSKGRVRSGGDIKAAFIENSHVYCEGQLTVKKNILSSQVFVGKGVVSGSLVGGGLLICRNDLICVDLGRGNGAITRVKIGQDFHSTERLQHLYRRCDHLKKAREDIVARMKHYATKSRSQKSEKQLKDEAAQAERKKRCEKIIAKVESLVLVRKSESTFNDKAQMRVSGTMSRNCELEIAGVMIKVSDDMSGVVASKEKRSDTHFSSLEREGKRS